MAIKLSEQVRRLEDTIESLRAENKKLREGNQKEFMITYKGQTTELPTEGNKGGDMYTISYKDRITGKIFTDKWIRYKNKWRNPIDVEHMISYERDEVIDQQKGEIAKLKKEIDRCKKLNDTLINNAKNDYEKYQKLEKELGARVEQVENLQDTLKKITKENERLKYKLKQELTDKNYQKLESDKDEFIDDDGMIDPKKFLDYLDKHFF